MFQALGSRTVGALVILVMIASGQSSSLEAATSDFIQTYIDAHHGCGRDGALDWVLTGPERQAPFGKPAAAWTNEDIEALNEVMSACVNAAARTDNPYALADVTGNAKRIMSGVPQIVASAREQKAIYDRQIAARKRLAEERMKEATRAAEAPTETAEDQVRRLEQEALKAQQDASVARQQKSLETLEENLRISRQKAEVERQQDMAIRQEQDRVATLENQRQRRAFLARENLTEASVLDLQSKGREFENRAVAITGYIKVFSEDNVTIYSGPNELNGIPLDLSTASSDTRRKIFASCSNLYRDCRMEIAGVVGFADHVFVWVR